MFTATFNDLGVENALWDGTIKIITIFYKDGVE